MVHFVLVHGSEGGAWHFYKLVDKLYKSGHKAKAIDLAASGTDTRTHADVNTFDDYNQPLFEYLSALPEDEKVVLVSHSYGGVNGAYALELYPHKIALGIFVAAPMSWVNVAEMQSGKFNPDIYDFFYGHGKDNPPTGMKFKPVYGSQPGHELCPSEDYTLTLIMARPVPTAASFNVKFENTEERYGSVPIVYIRPLHDTGLNMDTQDRWVRDHPFGNLKKAFKINSDHCAAMSAPSELHDLLVQSANSYASFPVKVMSKF